MELISKFIASSKPRFLCRRIESWRKSPLDSRSTANFFLEQQDSVEQRFRGWRAPGDIDVNRHNPVASAHHGVGVVIVAAPIGARTHRDDVARLRHLVVDPAQRDYRAVTSANFDP